MSEFSGVRFVVTISLMIVIGVLYYFGSRAVDKFK